MKKNKKVLISILVLVIGIGYFLLLNKCKTNINNIIDDLPYGYKDYYSEEFLNDIEEYKSNENTINLFSIYNISNSLSSKIKDNSCYKTNGLTPSIYIYTYDNSGLFLTKGEGYKDCVIVYIDEQGNPIFDYEAKVKIRGNSTSNLDKKPYTIKFNEKQNLIGAGEAKKWNLLADAYDPTLLRNNLFLTLAEKFELDYTPEHHYVEIYMDEQYVGCYLLTESVEVGKERVDIDLDKEDFFLEFESYRIEDDVYYFNTKHNIRLALKEPEEPTEEQLKYYEDKINELDKILFSGDYEKLKENFDLDSFAKLYLINEFAKTRDFVNSSINFYYKDGKMYAGPVWDFDLSAGNADGFKDTKYWNTLNGEKVSYITNYCRDLNPIFKQLFKYEEFNDLYKSYFDKYSDVLTDIYKEDGFIDSTIGTYESIFNRNYTKLDEGGAGWDISQIQDPLQQIPFKTYEENVDYLKEFLNNRYNWLLANK